MILLLGLFLGTHLSESSIIPELVVLKPFAAILLQLLALSKLPNDTW